MGKKKTIYTWIILILFATTIALGLQDIINSFLTPPSLNHLLSVIHFSLLISELLIIITFFFKLYRVTRDIIKWTHIVFGYAIFVSIFRLILLLFLEGVPAILAVIDQKIFSLLIKLVVWITFVNHLKKAKREKLMDFS